MADPNDNNNNTPLPPPPPSQHATEVPPPSHHAKSTRRAAAAVSYRFGPPSPPPPTTTRSGRTSKAPKRFWQDIDEVVVGVPESVLADPDELGGCEGSSADDADVPEDDDSINHFIRDSDEEHSVDAASESGSSATGESEDDTYSDDDEMSVPLGSDSDGTSSESDLISDSGAPADDAQDQQVSPQTLATQLLEQLIDQPAPPSF